MRRVVHSIERLRQELILVDELLQTPVDIYLIGGGAMGLAGLKAATKDIDVVLTDREAFRTLCTALERAGYVRPQHIGDPYAAMGAVAVYDKAGCPQWDLFIDVVCQKLRLTEGMIGRATTEVQPQGRLRLHRLAPSDIFIFKSITPRQADRDDMETIHTRHPLDWESVLNEMVAQSDPLNTVWSPAFVEAMEEFESRGFRVPILDRLVDLADKETGEFLVLKALRDGADSRDKIQAKLNEEEE